MEEFPVFNKMSKIECSGCEACSNACPVDIIKFEEDIEGFRYPIIDKEKCLNCNSCIKVCPCLNYKERVSNLPIKIYAAYSKNNYYINNSSSGGIFSVLAETFSKMYDDVNICGVRWADNFKYAYHSIESFENIEVLRGSKYVQSRKNDIYKQVQDKLDNGENILFVGTGCEVAGLKYFLKQDYNNLVTIDLICKGPTSEKVLREYVDNIEKKYNGKVSYLNMRYVGWRVWIPQWIKIKFNNFKTVYKIFYTTNYGRAFYLLQRRACYNCKFTSKNRFSDITLGDFHGAGVDDGVYNKKGTSVVLINTIKGENLFNAISDELIEYGENTYSRIAKDNPCLIKSFDEHPSRGEFVNLWLKYGLEIACKKTYPIKERIINYLPPEIVQLWGKIKRNFK